MYRVKVGNIKRVLPFSRRCPIQFDPIEAQLVAHDGSGFRVCSM